MSITTTLSFSLKVPEQRDAELDRIDRIYQELLNLENSQSLLKKYLTSEVFYNLRERRTRYGSSLADVIESGVRNPGSHIGVYAPDPEAFLTFAPLFNPIIEEYHHIELASLRPSFRIQELPTLIPDFTPSKSSAIISTRIRACRSLSGFAFHPRLTESDYRRIEGCLLEASTNLPLDFRGKYFSASSTDTRTVQRLQQNGLWFLPFTQDKYLSSAGAARFYPTGRGVFVGIQENFAIWVNEEDHLRFMCIEKGGNLGAVFTRLVSILQIFEDRLHFARDRFLGDLTFCPSNLGSTIRASVHVRLPCLGKDLDRLKELAESYNLQVRGLRGESSALEGEVFDVSNLRRLGLSEFEAVRDMQLGVQAILVHEQAEIERSMLD